MKVLKFGAVWCPTCLVMKPRWTNIEKELPWLETEFFDIDENPEVAEKHQATEPPVFIFLNKDGNEFDRMTGDISRKKLIKFLETNKNN